MSTAELIFTKAKALPESAQTAVLQIVELLAQPPTVEAQGPIQPGSATGLVTLSEDFEEALTDFEPYTQ